MKHLAWKLESTHQLYGISNMQICTLQPQQKEGSENNITLRIYRETASLLDAADYEVKDNARL